MSGSSDWPVWLAVGAGGVDGRQHIGGLGAGKEAQAGVAAGVAHGQAEHVGRRLLAVGVAQVAGQVDGVVQRDHGGAIGRVGQKGRGKVEIGDGRVLSMAGRAWRCRSPWRRPCESCLPSIDQAKQGAEVRTCDAHHRRRQELFHVAQAGGPCDQRAHRRAVALDLGLDGDHVAGVEAEGLHHVEAIGRVVEGEGVGRERRGR